MSRGKCREENSNWKGGRSHLSQGYIEILAPDHSRANKNGYVLEHVFIAEKALGKPLPPNAVVHHANGTRDSGPLVICQDRAYHHLLHQRMKAFAACGHANWRKCWVCQEWDDPINLYTKSKKGKPETPCHKKCVANRIMAKKLSEAIREGK